MVDFPSPSKNSNEERWPIFFLDRGADWADAVDAAVDVAVVAGAVDAAVDHDGCHMERGVVAAEFRLDGRYLRTDGDFLAAKGQRYRLHRG